MPYLASPRTSRAAQDSVTNDFLSHFDQQRYLRGGGWAFQVRMPSLDSPLKDFTLRCVSQKGSLADVDLLGTFGRRLTHHATKPYLHDGYSSADVWWGQERVASSLAKDMADDHGGFGPRRLRFSRVFLSFKRQHLISVLQDTCHAVELPRLS